MKKILVFADGSYSIVDTNSMATVNGQEPVEVLDATSENLEKYPQLKIVGSDITL